MVSPSKTPWLSLLPLGKRKVLRKRPGRVIASRPGAGRGGKVKMAGGGSAARGFWQEEVTTSSFGQSSAWAKQADVASQMVRPVRCAAIQSPFGTRTPDVVPFQVKIASDAGSTLAR